MEREEWERLTRAQRLAIDDGRRYRARWVDAESAPVWPAVALLVVMLGALVWAFDRALGGGS